VSERPGTRSVTESVPRVIRVAAAVSWRLLFVAAALIGVAWLFGYLAVVTFPIAIALLLSALFTPMVLRLVRWRVPRGVATALALVFGIAVVGGVLTLVITTFIAGLPDLRSQVQRSIQEINNWLQQGPLHLSQNQLNEYLNNLTETLRQNQEQITTGALSTATTVGEVLTGALLTFFVLLFFLYDGDRIWRFVIRGVPADVRPRVDIAGRRGFASLVNYVRATVIVAVVDAIGIGVGLLIVGVPLAVPLATLVFLGAFVPIIGAVVAGSVAVLVALVTNGFIIALIVLAIVIGVMQIESHILQPILLGRAVRLHPLAVVLAIAIGVTIGGIAGALVSVPLLAVLNAGIRSLLHEQRPLPDPAAVNVIKSDGADPTSPDSGPPDSGPPATETTDAEKTDTEKTGARPDDSAKPTD
jgi:predicted PurR-regulated permease PerM